MNRVRLARRRRWEAVGRGFTLVELLVVIGIIGLLIGILLPSLAEARKRALMTACASNLRQVGQAMLIYANMNRGQLFPTDAGGPYDFPTNDNLWFVHVLHVKPPPPPVLDDLEQWTPHVLRCQADPDAARANSYCLNDHLNEHGIRYGSRVPNASSVDVVVMGEKYTYVIDYYVQLYPDGTTDFVANVDPYHHGPKRGSNTLFLDLHVGASLYDRSLPNALDPWDAPK